MQRKFKPGDLVLRRVEKHSIEGKLAPNRDDFFRINKCLGNAAYKLTELLRKEIPQKWNATKLRRYYS